MTTCKRCLATAGLLALGLAFAPAQEKKESALEYTRKAQKELFEGALDSYKKGDVKTAILLAELTVDGDRSALASAEKLLADQKTSIKGLRQDMLGRMRWLAARYKEARKIANGEELAKEIAAIEKAMGLTAQAEADNEQDRAARKQARLRELAARAPAVPLTPALALQLKDRDRHLQEGVAAVRKHEYSAAFAALEKARDVERTVYGANSAEVAARLDNIAGFAEIRIASGVADYFPDLRAGQAVRIARKARAEALVIRRKLYGNDDWRVTDVRLALEHLRRLEKLPEADRDKLSRKRGELQGQLKWSAQLKALQSDKLREAVLSLRKEVLALEQQAFGDNDPQTMTSCHDVGMAYFALWDYSSARTYLEKSLAARQETLGKKHPVTAESLQDLGDLNQTLGNYAVVRTQLEQALAIRREVLGSNHPATVKTLNSLGKLAEAIGDFPTAHGYFQEVLEIHEDVLGLKGLAGVQALRNLESVLYALGKHMEAGKLGLQALEVDLEALKAGDYDHEEAQRLDAAYIRTLLDREQFTLLQAMLGIRYSPTALERELSSKTKNVNVATRLYAYGVLQYRAGDYSKARPIFEKALEIQKDVLGETHPDTAASLTQLGLLHAGLGEWTEAAEVLEQARHAVRRHVADVLPGLSEAEQLSYLSTQYQRSLHACLSLGLSRRDDPAWVQLSAGWLLNGKAVAHEALAQRTLIERLTADPETADTVHALLALRAERANLTFRGPPPDQRDAHARRLAALQEREQELTRKLGQTGGDALRGDPWTALEKVRGALPEDAVLVEIARVNIHELPPKSFYERFKRLPTLAESPEPRRYEPWQPARYVAWVMPPAGRGTIQVLDLGPADDIDRAVQQVRKALAGAGKTIYQEGEAEAEELLRKDLQVLAQRVLRPLLPAATKYRRWLVSPDASLWLAPWAALPLPEGGYLLEKYTQSYLVTGRDLAWTPAKRAPGPAVVFADPDFDLDPKQAAAELRRLHLEKRRPQDRGAPADPRVRRDWERLFATAREVAAITPKLKAYLGADPAVYVRGEALESVCKASLRPRVLLLCTHGYFLPDADRKADQGRTRPGSERPALGVFSPNPLDRCGLVLAGANQRPLIPDDAVDDGLLTGREVVGLDLRGTELVVLSACDTGLGDVHNGEGVAGLRQAFQQAGAQAVAASLWKVQDESTARLMARFWQELADDPDRAAALRKAQLAIIQARRAGKEKAAHPYFWAAFTLTGQWRPRK